MIQRIVMGVVLGAMVFIAVTALGWGRSAALVLAAVPLAASALNLLARQFLVLSFLFCVGTGIALVVPFERIGLSSASFGEFLGWMERSVRGAEKK